MEQNISESSPPSLWNSNRVYFLELIVSNFLLHTILETLDSSSEGLFSVKKWLLSRKYEALQIQFEQFLE